MSGTAGGRCCAGARTGARTAATVSNLKPQRVAVCFNIFIHPQLNIAIAIRFGFAAKHPPRELAACMIQCTGDISIPPTKSECSLTVNTASG